VIIAIVIAVSVLSSGSSSPSKPKVSGQPFASSPQPVPTNQVTGNGSATVTLNADVAAVTLDTHGLLNGAPHAMHIHAGGKGICPPASAAHLHNGHRSISTTDGIKFYGPPQVALTSTGDTSPKSIVDFTRYPTVGSISYERQDIIVPPGVAAAIRANDAVIVVHGIDYNHNGVYDDVLDRSELNNNLPGEATAPALCGPLAKPTTTASVHGPSTTYVASLHLFRESVSEQIAQLSLLCVLDGLAPVTGDAPKRAAGTPTAA
jgi:hypothetical protein